MLFRKSTPRYTIDEIHTYIQDIEKVSELRSAAASGKEHKRYYDILHVMQEVLLFMIDSLDPELQVKMRAEVKIGEGTK